MVLHMSYLLEGKAYKVIGFKVLVAEEFATLRTLLIVFIDSSIN